MGLFNRNRKDLAYEGVAGTAVVRTAKRAEFWKNVDEPERPMFADQGIGVFKYRFDLEVTLDDGREPYTVSDRFNVPVEFGEVDVGDAFPVLVDPDDLTRVEINWDRYKAEEPARIHDEVAPETRNAILDGLVSSVRSGAMPREGFEQSIAGLVDSGVVTAAEADAARAAIEGGG